MRFAPVTARLAGLAGAKWALHARARALAAEGRDVLEFTIGEPDAAPPETLLATAAASLGAGRTGYSNGRGEPGLLAALAARYTARRGRSFGTGNFVAFPGTQTALYGVLRTVAGEGATVLVADPMYATYAGLVAATGAALRAVPLRADQGFRLAPEDVAAAITPDVRAILINTPHNPAGTVMSAADLAAIGALAERHDLWIISDEVYEELVFPGVGFVSALDLPTFAERTVAVASISKSHAAPGLRSGWCAGPEAFIDRLLPLAETMLFGNQPFIADATAEAIAAPSPLAAAMAERFARRAASIRAQLDGVDGLRVNAPAAGMFVLIDIRATGLSGETFAERLLEAENVALMPGESFGETLGGWLRMALSQPDARTAEACARIARFVRSGCAGGSGEAA